MTPGFSERTFEFCFNAEYCNANASILAAHPHIPSQQMEKELGYDVEFEIRQGRFTRSLFLQHKVSAFASKKAGTNSQFFDAHSGPYYRFAIDNDQHNTLCNLSSTKGNAFYCAPRFHVSPQLESHFRAQSIRANSIWLDPMQVGPVSGHKRHNITYGPSGSNPKLHSVERSFKAAYIPIGEGSPPLRRSSITMSYVEELERDLLERAPQRRLKTASLAEAIKAGRPIQRVQLVLGRVFDVSWILLP